MSAENELEHRISMLPRAIAPPRDLWPAIEQGIVRPARPARIWLRSIAAGLAITLGAIFVLSYDSGLQPDDLGEPGRVTLMPNAGMIYANSIDQQYTAPLASLTDELPNPAHSISAGQLQLGLRTLQHATEEIRAALEQDPDSLYLASLLEATHRKRLNMLKDLALAEAGRNDSRST